MLTVLLIAKGQKPHPELLSIILHIHQNQEKTFTRTGRARGGGGIRPIKL